MIATLCEMKAGRRTGHGCVRLTIDRASGLLVNARQAIDILPVADRRLERNIFRIGNVIRDSAAFIACIPAGVRDLR